MHVTVTALYTCTMGLIGKRILVTRAAHQSSALAELLRARGAEPLLIPSIEIVPPTSFTALDEALLQLANVDWLIFTSANAVQVFAERCATMDANVTATQPRIAAIGRATERALHAVGLRADLVPPQAIAESLTEALLPRVLTASGTHARMLLVRAEEARDHLPQSLTAAGADLTIAPAYRTIVPQASIQRVKAALHEDHPDAVTFTSASTAHNLKTLLDAAAITLPTTIRSVSIGPITTHAVKELGWPVHAEAKQADLPSLVDALEQALS